MAAAAATRPFKEKQGKKNKAAAIATIYILTPPKLKMAIFDTYFFIVSLTFFNFLWLYMKKHDQ